MPEDSLDNAYQKTFPRPNYTVDIHLREDKESGNTRATVRIPKGKYGLDGEKKGSALHKSAKSAIAYALLDAMEE